MPTAAAGTTITLTAQYQDGTGTAVTPITPLISVLDPLGATIVANAVPTAVGPTGRYSYDYAIQSTALIGSWTAVWSGVVNTAGVESSEVFSVVEPGDIIFPPALGCTPMWATTADFIAANPTFTITEDEAMEVLIEATWLLSGLIGDRFHQAECRLDEYQSRRGLRKIHLAGWPVDKVFSVVRINAADSVESAVPGWYEIPGGSIRISCTAGCTDVVAGTDFLYAGGYGRPLWPNSGALCTCTCDDSVIRVEYRTKGNLPPGTKRAVLKLAREFWKSGAGQACALPERVTNVSREGVTWTLLDPLDFLDKGLTGIGSIDQWVSRVNLRGYAALIDPLTRPSLLLSELTGCGPNCSGGA